MSSRGRLGKIRQAWSESGSKRSAIALAALAVATVVLVAYAFASEPDAQPDNPRAVAKTLASMQAETADKRPVSLWVGDSYTAGTGAESESEAESCLTAQRLDWICNLDAQGGTGFIANGHTNSDTYEPLGKRLPATAADNLADIVIIDAGRNDLNQPLAKVKAAMSAYLAAVHRAYPDAHLVQVVPYFMGSSEEPFAGDLARFIEVEVAKYDGRVIDPIAEGWISPEKSGGLTVADKVHPNPAGHRYIAAHLAADLRKMGLPKSAG